MADSKSEGSKSLTAAPPDLAMVQTDLIAVRTSITALEEKRSTLEKRALNLNIILDQIRSFKTSSAITAPEEIERLTFIGAALGSEEQTLLESVKNQSAIKALLEELAKLRTQEQELLTHQHSLEIPSLLEQVKSLQAELLELKKERSRETQTWSELIAMFDELQTADNLTDDEDPGHLFPVTHPPQAENPAATASTSSSFLSSSSSSTSSSSAQGSQDPDDFGRPSGPG